MRALLAAGLLLLVAGCGGSDPPKTEPVPRTPTPTPAVSLPKACADLAAALPKGAGTYDAGEMGKFFGRLLYLNNTGDAQVHAALKPLAQPALDLSAGVTLARHVAFLAALNQVVESCRAAGSTALD